MYFFLKVQLFLHNLVFLVRFHFVDFCVPVFLSRFCVSVSRSVSLPPSLLFLWVTGLEDYLQQKYVYLFFSLFLVESCWLSYTNNLIWIFAAFMAFVEVVSLQLVNPSHFPFYVKTDHWWRLSISFPCLLQNEKHIPVFYHQAQSSQPFQLRLHPLCIQHYSS